MKIATNVWRMSKPCWVAGNAQHSSEKESHVKEPLEIVDEVSVEMGELKVEEEHEEVTIESYS